MVLPAQMITMLVGVLLLFLEGARAADVSTLIDMSTSEGAAFFSDIAAAQPHKSEQIPQTLYFTDTHANCLRQWTSTDGLRELAGECGHSGDFQNGKGSYALFSKPKGLCYHPQGFLAVTDSQNACIRSVSLDGEVDTLAGQCTHSGDADGDASEALFSTAIEGIACLSNCSILVADPSSRTVRIITPDGDCPGQPGSAQNNGGWRYKKPLIWTASALGVIAALGAGTLLVRPLLAKALRDRINKKRADVEEASQETGPHESSPLKGEVRSGCLVNYDDSAYRPCSSPAGSGGHQQAPLITLDTENEESGGSSGEDGYIAT